MKRMILVFSLILGLSCNVFCADLCTIVLKDGSTIEGEVISLGNGVYTVSTPSLGQVQISASQVLKIEQAGQSEQPRDNIPNISNEALKSQISSVQAQMASNPQVVSMMNGLSQDPAFQALMKDPEIMKAASSGDYTTLISNPKFREFANNSKVKEISASMEQQNR